MNWTSFRVSRIWRQLAGMVCGCCLILAFTAQPLFAQESLPQQNPAGGRTGQGGAGGQLQGEAQRAGYSVGIKVGSDLKRRFGALDVRSLLLGIQHAFTGQPPLLNDQEIQAALTAFARQQQARFEAMAAQNLKKGQEFLAQNKQKQGVQTLPSGLQYRVVKAGTGKSPTLKDSVTTHYRGVLLDGREFDSSYAQNQPATFPVGEVIKGWVEALQLMKEGAKWQLYVPPELAYGEDGAPPDIPPNSVLVFEIELLSVN